MMNLMMRFLIEEDEDDDDLSKYKGIGWDDL